METRKTCAKLTKTKWGDTLSEMCPDCSSANIDKETNEIHWECKKYHVTLEERDGDRWLLRCPRCLSENNID